MEDATENHLIRLHLYLLNNLHNRKEANIIRTELLTRYRLQFPEQSRKFLRQTKMCQQCFSVWIEGNFSIKFKAKKSKKKKSKKLITCVIKCFNCSKYTLITYPRPDIAGQCKKQKQKKRIADLKLSDIPAKKRKTYLANLQFKIPSIKNKAYPPVSRKKSSLTLLSKIL